MGLTVAVDHDGSFGWRKTGNSAPMTHHRRFPTDDTLGLVLSGYAWLPSLRRRAGDAAVVHTRLLGMRAVALRGPAAVPFFYDDSYVRRHTAIPEPVQGTLFGHGAIHTLDGPGHRRRKAMLLSVLKDPSQVFVLVDRVVKSWDEAARTWTVRPEVVLFDEAAAVITRGVCEWAGIALDDADVPGVAADLTAMVDGFATLGPRHWRARAARSRRERWLASLIEQVRAGTVEAPAGSALAVVSGYTEADGVRLDARHAAVELLNIIRPTVAVSWFVAFTGHALYRWPQTGERLRAGDMAYATAFAHEVRRFYPFAPFVGGKAVQELSWQGERIPAGAMVLFDLYGQDHDEELWPRPYEFDPDRFVGHPPAPDLLVAQGGGDARTGHRCPGEDVTVALLATLAVRLARLHYDVPDQDLTLSLRRLPALPRSRFIMSKVRLF
jgi:fatty-acid peroxygenase